MPGNSMGTQLPAKFPFRFGRSTENDQPARVTINAMHRTNLARHQLAQFVGERGRQETLAASPEFRGFRCMPHGREPWRLIDNENILIRMHDRDSGIDCTRHTGNQRGLAGSATRGFAARFRQFSDDFL